jgi:hypothetical protein
MRIGKLRENKNIQLKQFCVALGVCASGAGSTVHREHD